MINDDTVNLEDEIKDEELEDVAEEVTEETPVVPDTSAELKQAQDEAAKWRRIAEKKDKPPEAVVGKETNKEALSADEVDVKILQSQGTDEEHIEYLKKLASLNQTSVLAAQTDPIYITFKEQKQAEKKSKEASLGASTGSGSVKKGKGLSSTGLTEAEHKELWKKQNG